MSEPKDDLIARLRDRRFNGKWSDTLVSDPLCIEAADRIASLTEQVEGLTRERDATSPPMTNHAELIARLKPVADRAVAALRTQLGWVALADSLNEFITVAQEAADALEAAEARLTLRDSLKEARHYTALADIEAERDEAMRVAKNNADLWGEACKMVDEQRAATQAAEADAARMREALSALVTKLDLVHADEHYKAVWAIAQLHTAPYAGPSYAEELTRARNALGGKDG